MIRTRIAPTPSGFLHKGNIFSFLLTDLLCKSNDGRLVLRIDDSDRERTRPGYLAHIFDVLGMLGIRWDEGPRNTEDMQLHSQLNRLTEYLSLAEKLRNGGHLFACDCTRSMLPSSGQYPGTCIGKGLPFSDRLNWRLITPETPVTFYDSLWGKHLSVDLYEVMRHPVIRKKDGMPAYQLVSLADDVRMNINLVVRGKDLEPSTATQLYLAGLLQLDSFREARFVHHPLISDAGGAKLSKSAGSPGISPHLDQAAIARLKQEFQQWVSSFMPEGPLRFL